MKLIGSLALAASLAGFNLFGQEKPGFGNDVSFLNQFMKTVVLSDASGKGKVCVIPALQGRVMTSSAEGDQGAGYGWINYGHFKAGKLADHINVYGGEDRFWLGPEGGQFSIFFAKGAPFKFQNWFTPKCLDTEPFEVVSQEANSVRLQRDMRLTNYSGTELSLHVAREVRVLEPGEAFQALGVPLDPSVKLVAYQSTNTIKNTGTAAWTKQTGMLSIWILGMFSPSPATTIVIPYAAGNEQELGPVVKDDYFGKVPAERLVVKEKALYFSGDGKFRSKIGLNARRAKEVLGSYDAVNGVLTIVQYNKPQGNKEYVDSSWQLQKEPFQGDVVNSYNDGPNEEGKVLGPFYELETSSPAAALAPGESITHLHRTVHLAGSEKTLDPIARAVLGVRLKEIKNGLKK